MPILQPEYVVLVCPRCKQDQIFGIEGQTTRTNRIIKVPRIPCLPCRVEEHRAKQVRKQNKEAS